MNCSRPFAGIVVACLLSSSALAQHTAANRLPRVYDLKHVAWHLGFDEAAGAIQGDVTNVLSPLKPATKQVWFDSVRLNIQTVTVNGKTAAFKTLPERLVVTLPKPAGPKDTLAVRIQYTGRPDAGIYFIPAKRAFPAHTSVVYTQGEMIDTRYYLPTYDWPDDKATSESFIKVPSDYTVISNGQLVDVKPAGTMKVVHHKVDIPHATYLMSLVAGKYDVGNDGQFKGKPVRWNVPQGLAEMGKAAFGGTDAMIDVYSKVTGVDYPYAKFDQSAVPDYMFGGMENLSAVTQTIDALYPPEAVGVANSEGLVLHELAHQWFGDYVTCSAWEHAWINEGWATFLPPFFVRAAHGKEAYDVARYDLLKQAYDAQQGESRPVVWKGYADPIDEFSGIIYAGGAARMFVLMHMLGEDRFWKATKTYLNQYGGKSVSTPAFFASYSKSTGVDLTRFMKQWFYTAAMPQITVKRAGPNLLIQQAKPYFTLDLPVWVLKGDEWVKRTVHTDGPEVKLALNDLAANPVLVDPEVFLPAGITYGYPIDAATYMALYRHAPNDAARRRLQEKIFGVLSPEQVLELAKEFQNVELTKPLVQHVTDEAALLEFTRSPSYDVANTAAATLQNLPATDTSVARLRELFESHPNIQVRQTALGSILALTKDESLAKRAWTMPSYNDAFRQTALQWYRTNKPDEAREMALGVLANPDSENLRRTAIDMLGLLKDKPGERRVFNALAKVAKEPSFGARTGAINALAAYGDPAAIPIIQPTTHNGLHYLRRTAEAATQTLKQ